MNSETQIDGTIKETFKDESEYHYRLNHLQMIMGKHKLFFHGWLNSTLTIMYRE